MASRVLGIDIGSRHIRGVILEIHGRNVRLVQLIEEAIQANELPANAAKAAGGPDHIAADAAGPSDTTSAGPPPIPSADASTDVDDVSDADEGEHDAPSDNATHDASPDTDAPPVAPEIIDPIARRAWSDEVRQTLERIVNRPDLEIDSLIAAAPEGAFMYTIIELPFHGEKEVRAVLGPQLDDRLPGETDELHFDYMVAGQNDDAQWRLYAGGLAQREMAQLEEQWGNIDQDPRVIDVMPFPLYTAGTWLAPSPEQTVAYVDMSTRFTRIIITHHGEIEVARTIVGGGEDIAEAIAASLSIPIEVARVYKSSPQTAEDGTVDEAHEALQEALVRGLRSTTRDLRRTLAAHSARYGHAVDQIYVSGSAFDLPEVGPFLADALQLPLEPLRFDREEVNTIPNARSVSHRFITALGLALRGTTTEQRSHFNLRTGPWAFRGAYAYITQRATSIALLVIVLLFSIIFFLVSHHALLKAEYEAADDGLAQISKQVFGIPVRNPDLVNTRIAKGVQGIGLHPEVSAYDIAVRVSKAAQKTVDEGQRMQLTRLDVDMARRQVRISGVCDNAIAADTLGGHLKHDNCLTSVERNNLSQRRSDSKFNFSFTAAVNCTPPTDETAEEPQDKPDKTSPSTGEKKDEETAP